MTLSYKILAKSLNYSSIDERNKSVRDMFTGEARAINGLDTM